MSKLGHWWVENLLLLFTINQITLVETVEVALGHLLGQKSTSVRVRVDFNDSQSGNAIKKISGFEEKSSKNIANRGHPLANNAWNYPLDNANPQKIRNY